MHSPAQRSAGSPLSIYKAPAPINERDAETIWQELRAAFEKIYNKGASTLSFEHLYRNVYNLVLHRYGGKLYENVYHTILSHLRKTAQEVAQSYDDRLVDGLRDCWDDHNNTMDMICSILMYMERTFVKRHRKMSIERRGLIIFREQIVQHHEICGRLRGLLLDHVDAERHGQVVDNALMRSMMDMLVSMPENNQVYERLFEKPFLDATATFYQRESADFIVANTCPEYLKKAQTRHRQEDQRAQNYSVPLETAEKLRRVVQGELIKKHAKALVEMENSGCVAMMEHDRYDDLARMYTLYSAVGTSTLSLIKDTMHQHILETGFALIKDQDRIKDPIQFIQALMDMKDKFGHIISKSFASDPLFDKAFKDAFEQLVNHDVRPARFLALFVDSLFRRKSPTGDEELDAVLRKVIILFRYLKDKDLFESFYSQTLSKRLLGRNASTGYISSSADAEMSFVSKLKAECGHQFTSKIEAMFRDTRLSRELCRTMNNLERQHGKKSSVDMEVTVLTKGFWPNPSFPTCALPPVLVASCKNFEDFYIRKFSGRRLSWQAQLGTAELRYRARPLSPPADYRPSYKTKDLLVSTYQMVILLLFNTKDSLTFCEIEENTEIPPQELRRHLISLCTPRCKLLIRRRTGKQVKQDDSFELNLGFKSRMMRVKVPLGVAKVKNASKALPNTVAEDRRSQIEAAIVRILKARKSVEHNSLIAEVTRQCSSRFIPSPGNIKKRIESLMEREYLERSSEDSRIYNYLA